MLRVPIHNIQPKMILARPIPLPSDPQRFLLHCTLGNFGS